MADEKFLQSVGATGEDVHAGCQKRWLEERDARIRAEDAAHERNMAQADQLAEEWQRGLAAGKWRAWRDGLLGVIFGLLTLGGIALGLVLNK